MDGKLIGEVLGYYSHPDERPGKVFIFPHLFAEIMQCYMQVYGVSESDLAQIAVNEYQNAKYNPLAQMNKVQITLEQAMKIEGINRYVVEGLPLKTYDCSQITDGYAALILATEEGLRKLGVPKSECVEIAGYAQATDPLQKEGRNTLVPAGAYRAMKKGIRNGGSSACRRERGRDPRLFHRGGGHRDGSLGKGVARQGGTVLGGRQSQGRWRLRHQHVRRLDRERTSRGSDRCRHAGFVFPATERQGVEGDSKERSKGGCDLQYRGRAVRFVCTVLRNPA